jgi:hypothetical protein
MIIFLRYTPLFLILLCTFNATAQMKLFMTLKEALQASQKSNKNLIILRTEFSTIKFSKEKNYPTRELYIDDLLKTEQLQNALEDDFLVLLYDQQESSKEDQKYIKSNYFYDYTPAMIILNSKAKSIAYIRLYDYEQPLDLEEILHTTIREFEEESKRLMKLEKKYEVKSISSDELTDLITLRSNLYLLSKDYWNYFSTLNAKLPTDLEFSWSTFCKEDFSIKDSFFQFLMEADESYDDVKLSMISNLKELREMENDIESYQYLTATGDSITKKMFSQDEDVSGFFNTMYPNWEGGMEEANSMKMIEMYSKSGDDSLLIVTAENYVTSLLEGYDARMNNVMKGQDAMLESLREVLIANLPPSDTVFSWENFKRQSIESEVKSMSKGYSNDLNQIAWAYYEIVDSRMDLNKAIDWCQKSIDLNYGKENNDTLAHLYFKTGNRDKAIEYQTIALNIAESEGLQQERLKYYSDELEKFKTQ